MQEKLSVLLIAHNEEQGIGAMLEGLLANYGGEILEIIVVDDASTDRTAAIAANSAQQNAKVRLVRRSPPCGVGRALKTGFSNLNPQAEYVLTMDSDFVENIAQVRLLIDAMEKRNCDGVIGSRFVEGGTIPYKPEALAKKKANGEKWLTEDPEVKCYLPGIPRANYMPYPLQIVQSNKDILFVYEYASANRLVNMGKPVEAGSDTWMPGAFDRIGRCGPRTASGASGFMSNMSM